MDIKKILDRIETAQSRLTDDELFRTCLSETLAELRVRDLEFANELAVSVGTVERWKNGHAIPHPAMRNPVYAVLKRMVSALGDWNEDLVLDVVNAIEAVLEHTVKHVPEEHVVAGLQAGCLHREGDGSLTVTEKGEVLLAGYEAGRSMREGELDLAKAEWLRECKVAETCRWDYVTEYAMLEDLEGWVVGKGHDYVLAYSERRYPVSRPSYPGDEEPVSSLWDATSVTSIPVTSIPVVRKTDK